MLKTRILVLLLILVLFAQGCASQSSSRLIDARQETVTKENFDYYLYYPEEYEDEPDKKFPLLLFLHGGGESGDSLVTVKRNGRMCLGSWSEFLVSSSVF